jgi:hypothetical protein
MEYLLDHEQSESASEVLGDISDLNSINSNWVLLSRNSILIIYEGGPSFSLLSYPPIKTSTKSRLGERP